LLNVISRVVEVCPGEPLTDEDVFLRFGNEMLCG